MAHLFLAAMAADHPDGVLHFVIIALVLVVAHVARVRLAAARESQPTETLLVMRTGAGVGEGLPLLDGRVVDGFLGGFQGYEVGVSTVCCNKVGEVKYVKE